MVLADGRGTAEESTSHGNANVCLGPLVTPSVAPIHAQYFKPITNGRREACHQRGPSARPTASRETRTIAGLGVAHNMDIRPIRDTNGERSMLGIVWMRGCESLRRIRVIRSTIQIYTKDSQIVRYPCHQLSWPFVRPNGVETGLSNDSERSCCQH